MRLEPTARLTVVTERLPGRTSDPEPDPSPTGRRLTVIRALPTRVAAPQPTRLRHAVTYVLTQAWFLARLPRLARSVDAQAIHFHTRYRGRAFFRALAATGLPIIADLRDRRTDLSPLPRVAHRLVCVSPSIRDEIVACGFPSDRATVVPTPLVIPPDIAADPEGAAIDIRLRLGLGDAPLILFAGDVAHHKGIFQLLPGFERFRAEVPQAATARLVIAGVDHSGGALGAALEAAPGAVFVGPKPRAEILALMRASEVVVRPSFGGEGIPRVLQEAVAMGARVVAPPGIPEIEASMPECALAEVTPYAIAAGLVRAWQSPGPPALDLSAHRPDRTARLLLDVYRAAVLESAAEPPSAAGSRSEPASSGRSGGAS